VPLRPEIPPRRPGRETKPKPSKKLRRRRCNNCGTLYPLTKPTRKFCSEQCRKEFHQYGAAYGPLKAKLEKLIEQSSRDREARLTRMIDQLRTDLLARFEPESFE
jgi:hypothetical protein